MFSTVAALVSMLTEQEKNSNQFSRCFSVLTQPKFYLLFKRYRNTLHYANSGRFLIVINQIFFHPRLHPHFYGQRTVTPISFLLEWNEKFYAQAALDSFLYAFGGFRLSKLFGGSLQFSLISFPPSCFTNATFLTSPFSSWYLLPEALIFLLRSQEPKTFLCLESRQKRVLDFLGPWGNTLEHCFPAFYTTELGSLELSRTYPVATTG